MASIIPTVTTVLWSRAVELQRSIRIESEHCETPLPRHVVAQGLQSMNDSGNNLGTPCSEYQMDSIHTFTSNQGSCFHLVGGVSFIMLYTWVTVNRKNPTALTHTDGTMCTKPKMKLRDASSCYSERPMF